MRMPQVSLLQPQPAFLSNRIVYLVEHREIIAIFPLRVIPDDNKSQSNSKNKDKFTHLTPVYLITRPQKIFFSFLVGEKNLK